MFNKMNDLRRNMSIVYSQKRKKINLIGEPGLVSWKSCWDEVLNDEEFRSKFSGYEFVMNKNFITNVDERYLNNNNQNYKNKMKEKYKFNPVVKNGTLVIRGNGTEDHHLTFKIKNNSVMEVFDPSDLYGEYGGMFSSNHQKKLKIIAGVKNVEIHKHHPQCTAGDTFCQTWTIARLDPTLHRYTEHIPNRSINNSNPVLIDMMASRMTNIIHNIAKSTKFNDFLQKNRSEFARKFNMIRKKNGLPPLQNPVDSFINVSQHIEKRYIISIMTGGDVVAAKTNDKIRIILENFLRNKRHTSAEKRTMIANSIRRIRRPN